MVVNKRELGEVAVGEIPARGVRMAVRAAEYASDMLWEKFFFLLSLVDYEVRITPSLLVMGGI